VSFVVRITRDDALLACVVSKWSELNEKAGAGERPLGRVLTQKLCYFLRAKGVPMSFRFRLCHYGPYSQPLYYRMYDLVQDRLIADESSDRHRYSDYRPTSATRALIEEGRGFLRHHEDRIDSVLRMFHGLSPEEVEMLATLHYVHESNLRYHGEAPPREEVVEKVYGYKGGRFEKGLIRSAYDALDGAGLIRRTCPGTARPG